MKSNNLEFNIVFEVPAKIIFNAYTDPYEIMRWTRTKAEVEPKVGGKYSIYEGKIIGKFLEFEENKKITQEWKFNHWLEYSLVEITFIDRDDSCKIQIKQTNIPEKENIEKLEQGWKAQIFEAISKICGYPLEKDDLY